jgi:hypothetical protein
MAVERRPAFTFGLTGGGGGAVHSGPGNISIQWGRRRMKLTLIMSPAKGIYKQAVAPYKKGWQQVYMSSDLVIDGQTYKLVGIYPFSVLLRLAPIFDKFVVVDRDGNIVHDQNITWRCLRIFQLAVALKNNMGFMKQCVSVNHRVFEEVLAHFGELYSGIRTNGILNQTDDEDCQMFRHFLQTCVDSGVEMARIAKETLRSFDAIDIERAIEEGHAKELHDRTLAFLECSRKRCLLLLETYRPRRRVKEMLLHALQNGYFADRQKHMARSVIRAIDDFIHQEYTVINDENKQNAGEAIRSLQNRPDDFITFHTDANLQKHWLLREVHPAIPV